MPLPLTTPDGSTYRMFYSGPIGVAGVGAQQSWDLSSLPERVREDPTFQDNWRIFVRQVDPEVTAVSPDVAFTVVDGLPTEILLTVDSTDIAADVDIEFWYLHSIIR